MVTPDRSNDPQPSFASLFLGKVVLLFVTIVVVWALYAYLLAYRLDWLGYSYSRLLPLTNGLYALVENYFPTDVRYKVRGAITDELGQRSLFLLLLTAAVELTLYSGFKGNEVSSSHVDRPTPLSRRGHRRSTLAVPHTAAGQGRYRWQGPTGGR